MRISDWSSDVCSSDLIGGGGEAATDITHRHDSHHGEHRSEKRAISSHRQRGDGFGRHGSRGGGGGHRGPSVTAQTQRSEEHTSELQSLMRISYAVFCLKKKKHKM